MNSDTAERGPQHCGWAAHGDALERAYHDSEWGVPVHDDRVLLEFLILEGAQAGLSWRTILHKREGYRRAFAGFDAARIAAFGEADIERLVRDAGIVRHRGKITAAIGNARAFLQVQAERGRFTDYLWAFTAGQPVVNQWRDMYQVPAVTPLAERLSRDLRRRGFRFVGPTICYAYLQAVGVVNDHLVGCFRHRQV